MKKTICWLTLLCLLASALPALAEGDGAHAVTGKTVTFYWGDPEAVAEHTVYFVDGADVPYLALSEWQDIVQGYIATDSYGETVIDNGGLQFNFSMAGNTGMLTREDGYTAAFDCDADTLHFVDLDAFLRLNSSDFLYEMVGSLRSAPDGPVRYLQRRGNAFERYGSEVTIDAGAYGIDFIAEGGECYVPMQTLSDLMLGAYSGGIFWNGEIAVVCPAGIFGTSKSLTPIGEIYYAVEPRARSEAMAKYSYGELCLALDTIYGMRQAHGIDSFDALIEDVGLKDDLMSTDPAKADAALYQLLEVYLDDPHTAMRMPSPLSGAGAADGFRDALGYGDSKYALGQQRKLYSGIRAEAYPDGVPGYEEIGNTAWITMDGFSQAPDDVDYYQTPPTDAATDTMGLLAYAYARITREDSPVENVVLDLSCNMGGMTNAAIYTLAAFLGVGSLSTKNTLSGAMVTGHYAADLNLDGVADENDLGLLDKNLFCLESPVSFSCANLVCCAFKASNRVSLLGRTSGGGACFVQPFPSAYGSACQISTDVQMSFIKNGVFYDNDRGAEPDIPLLKPASFYDREGLSAYINSLR